MGSWRHRRRHLRPARRFCPGLQPAEANHSHAHPHDDPYSDTDKNCAADSYRKSDNDCHTHTVPAHRTDLHTLAYEYENTVVQFVNARGVVPRKRSSWQAEDDFGPMPS